MVFGPRGLLHDGSKFFYNGTVLQLIIKRNIFELQKNCYAQELSNDISGQGTDSDGRVKASKTPPKNSEHNHASLLTTIGMGRISEKMPITAHIDPTNLPGPVWGFSVPIRVCNSVLFSLLLTCFIAIHWPTSLEFWNRDL